MNKRVVTDVGGRQRCALTRDNTAVWATGTNLPDASLLPGNSDHLVVTPFRPVLSMWQTDTAIRNNNGDDVDEEYEHVGGGKK